MNDLQIKKKVKEGTPGRYSIGDGLYLRISEQGTSFWTVRYSIDGRRREIIIGRYTGGKPGGLSLADAKLKSAQAKAGIREGLDPLTEKKRSNLVTIKTVAQVAEDWLQLHSKRIRNAQIPRRIFDKEISPAIGELAVSRVVPLDILGILRRVTESHRPAVANDTLALCKKIFSHAVKLGLISHNPALLFSNSDAGGAERSRERALSMPEIEIVFRVLRENSVSFSRENYLAVGLLLVLGIRKSELIQACWKEFDLKDLLWRLDSSRTKTGASIVIPIPPLVVPWLEELKIRSCGSDYLFPNRKQDAKRPYISPDTLNHALAKLFGEKVDSNKRPSKNAFGDVGISHFVIHDLRRTCRSLLAANSVAPHVAERCLNHKVQGVLGVYDRYDYMEERRAALTQLSEQIAPIVNAT